jgi:hypothetical protein
MCTMMFVISLPPFFKFWFPQMAYLILSVIAVSNPGANGIFTRLLLTHLSEGGMGDTYWGTPKHKVPLNSLEVLLFTSKKDLLISGQQSRRTWLCRVA